MNVYLGLQLLYDAVLAVVCIYAVGWGGTPERIGAAVAVGASGLTVLVVVLLRMGWQSRAGLFLVDASALIGLGILAFRTDRFWPLWATAFQTVSVVTHAAMLVEPARVLQAYVILQGFWAYPILASLALGTRRRGRSTRS